MEVRRGLRGQKKGILLTLLVVVIFILMLSEITAYIVIDINFNQLTQASFAASTQGDTAKLISSGAESALHASLSKALYAFSVFEANSLLRSSIRVNSTATALATLIENGTVSGYPMNALMGSTLMDNFSNSINSRLMNESISVAVQNSSVDVFQTSSSAINATYTALAVVNTTTGTFRFPIFSSVYVPLNGTTDLSSAASGSNTTISLVRGLPAAILIGGISAVGGSISPYAFDYGTLVYEPSAASCSSVPSQLQHKGFILAIPDASGLPQSVCGMGGLITNVPPAAPPLVPYLVYGASSNIFNAIQNGTSALIVGNTLSLLNVSALQGAIQTGSYFGASQIPSYLDAASGPTRHIGSGLFSFNLLHTEAAYFTDQGSAAYVFSNITVTNPNAVIAGNFSVSFWMNKNTNSQNSGGDLITSGKASANFGIATLDSGGGAGGSTDQEPMVFAYTDPAGAPHLVFTPPVPSRQWVQGAVVFSPNTVTWYIDGNKVSSESGLPNPGIDANVIFIGSGGSYAGAQSWNGSIADVQIYNAPLSSAGVRDLYLQGIAAPPLANNAIVAWWPLDGNANDYSRHGFDGAQNQVVYKPLANYFADPVYRGAYDVFNSSAVAGVLNCDNFAQCGNFTQQHLFIQNLPLTGAGANALSESAALGIQKAVLPMAIGFAGAATYNPPYGFVEQKNSIGYLASASNPFSYSIWVYPTAGGGTIIDENNYSQGYHTAILSLQGGQGYMGFNTSAGAACQSIGSIPKYIWTNIVVTYDGAGNLNGYVNGALVNTLSATMVAPTNSVNYTLGESDASGCGQHGSPYSGSMADYKVYSSALSATQVAQLYMNNTLSAADPIIDMPLDSAYNGLENTTQETISGNYGVFHGRGRVCTPANTLNLDCGVYYTPP